MGERDFGYEAAELRLALWVNVLALESFCDIAGDDDDHNDDGDGDGDCWTLDPEQSGRNTPPLSVRQ